MKKRVSKLCTFEQQHTFIDLESSFHHCNYEDLEKLGEAENLGMCSSVVKGGFGEGLNRFFKGIFLL